MLTGIIEWNPGTLFSFLLSYTPVRVERNRSVGDETFSRIHLLVKLQQAKGSKAMIFLTQLEYETLMYT